MAISSLEGLEVKLSRELAWRKKEITDFRISIVSNSENSSHLCRAGLVLACAHWEGLLRKSIEIYINYVFSKRLKIKELSPAFVSVAYYSDVRKAAEVSYPGSADTHLNLAQRIQRGIDEVCDRPGWSASTEGNPSSEVVARLLSSIGLDVKIGFDEAMWNTMRIFIDKQIVADRNSIAHGEGLPLRNEEFLERTERLFVLFEQLINQLLQAAEMESYRSPRVI